MPRLTHCSNVVCKRMVLYGFDLVTLAILSCIACLALARPAWAYVDPSVMTYTIQALAGVAVALSAVAGVALRRTRRMLLRALKIDENAGKTIEADVHRVNPETGAIIEDSFIDEDRKAESCEEGKRGNGGLSWKMRFAFSLVGCFFLGFTLFFVAPIEMVASNSGDLIVGVDRIIPIMGFFSFCLALVLALLISMLKDRAFNIALAIVVALGVAAWVETMFMNSLLPTADGSVVKWRDYDTITTISGIVWLAIIALFVTVCSLRQSFGRILASVFAIALILVQGVGLGSLLIDFQPEENSTNRAAEDGYVVTEEGLFQVSEKENVIVFVLDFFDTKVLIEDMETDPSVLDEMEGFTWFKNSTGSMIPTRYGVPYLLTGEMPQENQSYEEFISNRYLDSSFMQDIYDAGYSIGVYSDTVANGLSVISPLSINIKPEKDIEFDLGSKIDAIGTICELSKCALYRDAPWVVKRFFWFYTDEINNAMIDKDGKAANDTPYVMNDMLFNQNLHKQKLEAVDDDEVGAFRFIHLLGAHFPYIMNANCQPANEEEANMAEQSRGSLAIVSTYLSYLKDLGLYEDATIIITSDHGMWYLTEDDLGDACSPILLVKPSGSTDEPCQISMAQTGHVDYPATVMQAVGGDWKKYGSTVWEAPEQGRVRLYDMTASNGKHDTELRQFEIVGDVLDYSNWSLNGVVWEIEQKED